MSAPRVVLFGPPGAGKGTQSERIADAFDVDHVATGDILRANRDMETDYGTPREYMEAGKLVPDEVMNEVVAEALSDREGYVLDGYPRSMDQAEFLAGLDGLDVAVFLDVSEAEVRVRITGRRTCPDCDANFHVEYDPPAEEGVCDRCGAALVRRDDATEEALRTRLSEYREKTVPVIEFYRDEAGVPFVEVDGEQSPDEVWADVRAAVAAHAESADD